MSRTTRLWLIVLPLALLASAVVVALVLTSDHEEAPLLTVVLGGLAGFSFIIAGLIARTRRPENRTGLLLIAVGFAWYAAGLTGANNSVVWTFGLAVSAIFAALFVHLLLAYPGGRLESRWERRIVVAGYVLAALGNLVALPFDQTPIDGCDDCPENALLVAENETTADVVQTIVESLAAPFLLSVVVVLVVRWRRSSSARRRLLTPVLVSGTLTVLLLGLNTGTQSLSTGASEAFGFAAAIAFLTVPFLFLWGVLRTRLARADVGEILRAEVPSIAEAERLFRAALGDPTARIFLWLSEQGAYVGAEGGPVELPAETDSCAISTIEDQDGRLGALAHDPSLRSEPDLLNDLIAALRLVLARNRSVEALRASERRSRALLEALPDNMYRISRDGVYLDFYAQEPDRIRLPLETLIGSTVWDYPVPHQTTKRMMETAERVLETGTVETFEFQAEDEDGSIAYREGRVAPSGKNEFLFITRDITDRKLSEHALQSSEQRSRALLEAIPDTMFRISRDGRYLDFHAHDPGTLRRPPEEIIGSSVYEYGAPAGIAERIMAAAEQAFATGEVQTLEWENPGPDGRAQFREARITPSGEDEFFLISRNITGRKEQEQKIRDSELRSRALLEAMPDNMFRLSGEGVYLDFHTHQPETLLGPAGEIIGSRIQDYGIPEALVEKLMESAARAFETGTVQAYEYELEHDGVLRHREARITASGEDEFVVVIRDIDERKRQEAELRSSAQRSRALLEALPDNMFRISRDGTFLDYHANEMTFLMDPEEIVGAKVYDYPVARELIDRIMDAAETAFETGERQTVEYELEEDGVPRYQEARIKASGEDEFFVVIRDVTDRKRSELVLEREQNFVAKVVNTAPTYFCVLDPQGEIVRFNMTLSDATGRHQDTVGKPFWEAFVVSEEAEAFQTRFREARAGREFTSEHQLPTPDGELSVLWKATEIEDAEGRLRYLFTGLDVTERNRYQDDLERRRDFLSAIADATPAFLCVIYPDGRLTADSINAALRQATGYTIEETSGCQFSELFLPAESVEGFEQRVAATVAGEEPREHETEWLTKDGRRMLVAWTCTALPAVLDAEEAPFLISGVDVTRRRAQEDEHAALSRVAVAVASEGRTEGIFDIVTEEVGRLLGAHTANLIRFEPEGDEFLIVGRWSEPGVFAQEVGSRQRLQGGPVNMVYETGLPVLVDLDEGRVASPLARQLRQQGVNSVVAAPITVSGELWGAVSLSLTGSDTFPPGSEDRVAEFSRLVALALANEEAREQLAASRARIVEAGDEERRRLERNLHDGAQQRLVSLSLALRMAQAKLVSDPGVADELLSSSSVELALALEELRELARGIHPAVLTERGLGPALESLADRAPLPVELERLPEQRLPAPVEAAAFYVVSEALTNVAKYAGASAVKVSVAHQNGLAFVEVADDGVGGADPTLGSGLRGLADRVEALEGRLEVESEPGVGTRIRAEIPLA